MTNKLSCPGHFENAEQQASAVDLGGTVRRRKWVRVLATVSSFFLGQGALQAVNAVVGLFLVRTLTIEAYAQFGLAFGFQSTAANLMDLGFASTIIPLVGDRLNDRNLVGKYVRAAIRLRLRAFFLLAPFTVAAFVALAHAHQWSARLQILLVIPVLLALYSSGNVSCYSAPFFLYRRLTEFYAPQTWSGLVRLAAYVLLEFVGGLNAWTAAALSALNTTFISRVLAKKCRNNIGFVKTDTRSAEREIVHYVMPAMPALIFGALQSQISLFLISIFGQTTSIAQVAALSRIAQLFVVLQVFNMVVVEPYIARLGRHHLLNVYIRLMTVASICCVSVAFLAFKFPEPILWILGSKYEELRSAVGWLVLSSCIGYLANLAWVMNRARRWVFWSGTILEIVLLVVAQSGFIVFVGIRTTLNAVLFTLVSSVCFLIAHAYNAIYGFWRGPRAFLPAEQSASSLPG